MALYKLSLFIFRRDLRLEDNTGLIEASAASEQVIPCFMCDPRQISATNEYRSLNALQFMHEALADLNIQIKKEGGCLYFFEGPTENIIETILKEMPVDAIFVNRDYTPFSLKRDQALEQSCVAHHKAWHSCNDLLLHEPEEIISGSGTPYVIFTPFYKKASGLPVRRPETKRITNWYTKPISSAHKTVPSFLNTYQNDHALVHGTQKEAQSILKKSSQWADYINTHDCPSMETTHASAFLKFGLFSVRHFYFAIADQFGQSHALIRQLFWRDFFCHIAYFSPFVFGQPFNEKYLSLEWHNNQDAFKRWCTGKTGFPIVDAGMRQLNETGYMHNRVRLLAASLLVKDLHIDWRWGEKYFAHKLIDYDPAINNGNWQWVASTGADAQPYFRIFNPWLQQKRWDPACAYIKRWIPELKKCPPADIHAWFKTAAKSTSHEYPAPLVDHAHESTVAKDYYKDAINSK